MFKLKSTRHARYWCAYHFVWIQRYSDSILVGDATDYTNDVLKSTLVELGCKPLEVEVVPGHVNVFALCPPRHSPAYIANYLKGKSARRILQKFPELKKKTLTVSCGVEAIS